MLARVYLDNFRSFENFDYRLQRKQLVFGPNGSGKSSFLEAVLLIRQIAVGGMPLDEFPFQLNRTRWVSRNQQAFELEAILDGVTYLYRLVLEPHGDPSRTRIALESLFAEKSPLLVFENMEVRLQSDLSGAVIAYPFDPDRSALATIAPRADNQRLTRFKQWLSSLFCFRINPFAISPRAEAEHLFPKVQLDNYAAWYRHLVQADQRQNFRLVETLRSAMDGFRFLELQAVGENMRVLVAEFASASGSVKYVLPELSEGQRCLLCLYTILHFLLEKGATVFIDEPDNFIALREIQPWLMAASDAVEESASQLILISHHPEILDQWAAPHGLLFSRDSGGPTRVRPFSAEGEVLPPSQLVARGWLQ